VVKAPAEQDLPRRRERRVLDRVAHLAEHRFRRVDRQRRGFHGSFRSPQVDDRPLSLGHDPSFPTAEAKRLQLDVGIGVEDRKGIRWHEPAFHRELEIRVREPPRDPLQLFLPPLARPKQARHAAFLSDRFGEASVGHPLEHRQRAVEVGFPHAILAADHGDAAELHAEIPQRAVAADVEGAEHGHACPMSALLASRGGFSPNWTSGCRDVSDPLVPCLTSITRLALAAGLLLATGCDRARKSSAPETSMSSDLTPAPDVTPVVFRQWRDARRGTRPAEDLTNPHWIWLIRSGESSWAANEHFGGPSSYDGNPVW
jgi:hypothetical protein